MKNKRIINFTLVFVLILSLFNYLFVNVVFADEYDDWVTIGDENDLGDTPATSVGLFIDSTLAISEIAKLQMEHGGLDISNYDYVSICRSLGTRDGVEVWFVPKDCIVVREQLEVQGSACYEWTCWSYDGVNLVQQYFLGRGVVEVGHTSCYRAKSTDNIVTRVSYESPHWLDYQCKYAYNQEYALKYFQTMDSSWLENGDDFVDVPKPMNLSFYLASSENGGYLYWENELYDGMLYPSTEVILTYQYSNLEGEYTNITSQSIYLDYNTRSQQFVDFSVFNEYDNGRIVAFVRNKLNNYVNGKEFVGDFVKLEYVLDSDIYYSYSSDTDANPKQYPIVDYENKNPSYTGGTGGTPLFPGFESDYGWLDGVFNAFGLVGDNGLVQFMGDLFSFIPTPIFVALSGFVFAAIIIALFKMFVK